ncbi:MAG: efflux RND transporter permease subunit [Gammaproteobacteria bacterium]
MILEKAAAISTRYPWWTIIILIGLTLVTSSGFRHITMDTDVLNVLPEGTPERELYNLAQRVFPAKEVIVMGIGPSADGRFDKQDLHELASLFDEIAALPGIDSLLTPLNIKLLQADQDDIQVKSVADLGWQGDAQTVVELLQSQPLVRGVLVNEAGDAFAALAFVKNRYRDADVAQAIVETVAEFSSNGRVQIYLTGRPISAYWSRRVMGRDMEYLTTAALLVMGLLLTITFRSFRGVLLPLSVVLFANVWTVGLMGFLRIPFTHTLEVLPILLTAVGITDGAHMLKGYYRHSSGSDKVTATRTMLNELTRPVVYTSVTTFFGFAALAASNIRSLTELGALTGLGIIVAMMFSLLFIPAVLSLLPAQQRRQSPIFTPVFRLLERASGLRPQLVIGIFSLISLAAIWPATALKVEFSTVSNYRSSHPFGVANAFVNANFKSITGLSILVSSSDGVLNIALLRKVDRLKTWLLSQEHVGQVQVLSDYLKQMNQVTNGGLPNQFRLPDVSDATADELIAQYMLIYEVGGRPQEFANLISFDQNVLKMNVFLDTDSSYEIGLFRKALQSYLQDNGISAQLTGMAEILRAVNEQVVSGQFVSIMISAILIFVSALVLFRRMASAALCLVPLAFAVIFNFGLMGATAIKLNVETMATSAIAIGVGVDYAIHLLHRFQANFERHRDRNAALRYALTTGGPAILVNATVVSLGFFTLLISEFSGVRHLGLLIGLTMLTSCLATLILLPAILRVWPVKQVLSNPSASTA